MLLIRVGRLVQILGLTLVWVDSHRRLLLLVKLLPIFHGGLAVLFRLKLQLLVFEHRALHVGLLLVFVVALHTVAALLLYVERVSRELHWARVALAWIENASRRRVVPTVGSLERALNLAPLCGLVVAVIADAVVH